MTTSRPRRLALFAALATAVPLLVSAPIASAAPGRPTAAPAIVRPPAAPIPVPAPDHSGTGLSGWTAKTPRLSTPWTSQVSPTNALPEYPRPQLTRRE
jgi:hypothetical protein